jgi:hypothetical protein
MNEERLRKHLQGAAAPDELGAERRGWGVVREAYAAAGVSRERRWPTRPLVALAAVLALGAAALSPPGQAIGGWVRDRVSDEPPETEHVLAALPGPGRLLVTSERGVWVVANDGSKRLLGPYEDATWSPSGRYVAVTRGPRLVAVTPDGDIRWTLTRRGRVVEPRWSPSGFRIAYGVGGTLRVVSGDGSPDRRIARRAVVGTWTWRPGEAHVLAYVSRGVVRVVNTDSGRLSWSWRGPAEELAWSADGRRLIAVGGGPQITIFHPDGRVIRRHRIDSPGAGRNWALSVAPRGRAFAVLSRFSYGPPDVILYRAERQMAPRRFSTGTEAVELEWSPDGRRLLIASAADARSSAEDDRIVVPSGAAVQWIFLSVSGRGKLVEVSGVGREFDPGGVGPTTFPEVEGWCCPD